MSAIHYAGRLSWKTRDGYTHSVLPGWAACCSGDRAERIRDEGRNTFDTDKVTCKACLRCLALAATPPPRRSGEGASRRESKP